MASSPLEELPTPHELEPPYPPIIPGGSLIVAYQIRGKKVLIIGGGNVAASRLFAVLCADALVTIIAPQPLHHEIQQRLTTHPHLITHHARTVDPTTDLTPEYSLVLAAIDDAEVSSSIHTRCHELRIPVNIADVPHECDFYFGSVHRDGPLQVMVSTNGNGPKLANILRKRVAESLPPNAGQAITKVGILRRKLRTIAPGTGTEDVQKRMEWMTKVSEGWSLEELGEMGEEVMDRLLDHWAIWVKAGGEVPGYQDLMGMKEGMGEQRVETGGGGWFGSLGWF